MNITNSWHRYAEHPWGHTVVGDVRTLESIYSPELRNRRKLYVYLPPSYAHKDRRYPVIYMQDGQNLFDQALSYAGEWQVDETMEALSQEGIEAIVVGVPNAGIHRIDEYSPFKDQRLRKGGRGDWYVAFLANTVKPLIDRDFRTLPEREHTGVLGSSMGGLISLYAFFCRPEVFGFAGAMSPSLWFAQEAILPYVRQAEARPGQIHLDLGTHEGSDTRVLPGPPPRYTSRYLSAAHRMRDLLARKGYRLGQELNYHEEEEATHNEAAWARRLPDALRFLLARYRRPVEQLVSTHEPSSGEPWWEF
ncbi:MAG TPA: alpha/beta hydrolase-fold protein [Roseiflexaceae bacterium]|nr:alpha/beta hydrolase-fold protein [Roseiflexaceae bacterium]